MIYFFIITTLILLPQINFTTADEKPDYVGIDVNDVIIWKVAIDDNPYKDFLEDGEVPEYIIENITDIMFDDLLDEDVEGWKVVILEIKDEKEKDYKGDEVNLVPYLCNIYTTDDWEEKDWKEEEENQKGTIGDYSGDGKDVYVDRVLVDMGLFYWIAGTNVNWEKLADEVDEEFEDDWDGKDEDAGATVAKSLYKENGISTFWNPDEDDYDDFESTAQFNDDGILMYYEWEYDGDPIIILELEGQFFYEYWEIILAVAVAGVVVVILIVVKVKRRKR